MTLTTIGVVIVIGLTLTCGVRGQDDDSLTASFFSDLFDSLTNTADTPDCPGTCIDDHKTLTCDEVLEDFYCPTASMRCCVHGPLNSTETSSENDIKDSTPTSTEKPITPSYPAIMNLSTTTTIATTTTSPSATSTAVTTAMLRESEEPSRPQPTKDQVPDKSKGTAATTHRPEPPPQKPCRGECTSGFFVLFCDNIDDETDCPDGGSCCISDPPIDNEVPITTSPPPTTESSKGDLLAPTTITPPPMAELSKDLPPCIGVCTEPLFAIFCEKPSAIIYHTSTCEDGFICCKASDSSSLQSQSLFYRRLHHRIRAAKVNVPLMLGSYAGEGDYSVSPTCSVAPWLLECKRRN
ncbi:protein masquerade-like [Diachasmimorpha longicaudata]|uniref:protein masquerade-like n=1 Tax=Diachasmimorpha longicaudata TaxID=58733 RepID=UPI0030B89525